jgi:hypothetical protein
MSNAATRVSSVIYDSIYIFGNQLGILLAAAGFILSIGFLVADITCRNYDALLALMSPLSWAVGFGLYAIFKLATSTIWSNRALSIVVAFHGLWLWSYVAMSFLFFDPSPISPVELLLVMPILKEMLGIIQIIDRFDTDSEVK